MAPLGDIITVGMLENRQMPFCHRILVFLTPDCISFAVNLYRINFCEGSVICILNFVKGFTVTEFCGESVNRTKFPSIPRPPAIGCKNLVVYIFDLAGSLKH